MLQAFKDDLDLHSLTGTRLFSRLQNKPVVVSKKVNKHLRDKAKIVNFGIPYGMSAYKFSNDFKCSIEEAEDIIEAYFDSYPALRSYFKKARMYALSKGHIMIDHHLGRKSYFGAAYFKWCKARDEIEAAGVDRLNVLEATKSTYYEYKGKFERRAVNYKIQGTAANMTKEAAMMLNEYKMLNDCWDLFHIVNIVHDEIVIHCKECQAEFVASLMKKYMELAGTHYCSKVIMKAEPMVTNHWTH